MASNKSICVAVTMCALALPWFFAMPSLFVHSRREASVDIDDVPGSENPIPEVLSPSKAKKGRVPSQGSGALQMSEEHQEKLKDSEPPTESEPTPTGSGPTSTGDSEQPAPTDSTTATDAPKKVALADGKMGLKLKPLEGKELDTAKADLESQDLSEKHATDPNLKDVLPKGSEKYAFAYPGNTLTSGAFVYYDKDDKVIAINKVEGKGEDINFKQHEVEGKGEFELKAEQNCKDDKAGYHPVTIFENAAKYCWQPECKVADDKTLGCFIYAMTNGKNRAYVTVAGAWRSAGASIPLLVAMLIAAFQ